MTTDDNEKPTQVINLKSGSMWCESCEKSREAMWTTIKIYRGGREVERQKCIECKTIQETEYYTGPTTRIQNNDRTTDLPKNSNNSDNN